MPLYVKDGKQFGVTEKQHRMLMAGKFHFTSNRDDLDNHCQARELEKLGLIEIHEDDHQDRQEIVYNCTVLS